MVDAADLAVKTLGPCRVDSPLMPLLTGRQQSYHNVDESDRVLFDDTASAICRRGVPVEQLPGFEPAGPRRKIFFDPSKCRAGIATCGGLCPGLNNVIRNLVMELTFHYGVRKIYGFRNGYQGFIARYGRCVVDLTPDAVSGINEHGGTILGTSRGAQDPREVVDCLERMSINVLLVIGGDGTLRGAIDIANIIAERDEQIAVVGIPKTIDNDIQFIDQSFGFQTAFSVATTSIRSAHVEAKASPNGVGLVQADGSALGLHRLLRFAGHERRQLRLDSRGAFLLAGRKRLARRAPQAAGTARACRSRRRRRGRAGFARKQQSRRQRDRRLGQCQVE